MSGMTPIPRLFVQQPVRLTKTKTSKLRIAGPLFRESTGHRWIPVIKDQKCGKRFLIMCYHDGRDGGTQVPLLFSMMTSSNGNIFRVTGHLCGEFTGPGEFPAQRPVMRSFDVLICAWINDWINNREAGDLRRHGGHYDVNVMLHE